MSEIDRKSRLLTTLASEDSDDEIEDILKNTAPTTPGSVAAAITSALGTADGRITDEEEEDVTASCFFNYQNNHHNQPVNQQTLPSYRKENNVSDKPLHNSNHNNNNFINLDNTGIDKERSLVNNHNNYNNSNLLDPFDKCSSRTRPFDRFVDCSETGSGGLDRIGFGVGGNVGAGDPERERLLNRKLLSEKNADGNHVGISSSDCIPFVSPSSSTTLSKHLSSSTSCLSSSLSSSMADKEFSVDSVRGGADRTGQTFRDQSHNRETYQVSHHQEEKSTAHKKSSSGTGSHTLHSSGKIIDLPEKSSDHSNHQHHHHHHPHQASPYQSHHHRKDSKIPVGIAVAWQRLVTTTSTNSQNSSAITAKSKMESPNPGLTSSTCGLKQPARPSSVSPMLSKSATSKVRNLSSSISGNSANGITSRNGHMAGDNSDNNSSELSGHSVGVGLVPLCPSPASPLNRPLPSSSVPPNMGYPMGASYHHHPHHHQYLHHPQSHLHAYQHPHHRGSPYGFEYGPYATSPGPGALSRTFAVPSPLASPHHTNLIGAATGHSPYWGSSPGVIGVTGLENPSVPLLSPGIPSSPGSTSAASAADYFLQQQMHLHSHSHSHPHISHQHQPQQHLLPSSLSASPVSPPPFTPYIFSYPHRHNQQQQHQNPAPQQHESGGKSSAAPSPYDQYFHHHQQQQQQHLHGINGGNAITNSNPSAAAIAATATATSSVESQSSSSCSGGGRVVPLSGTGSLRTPTPTMASSSSAAGGTATTAATTTSSSAVVSVTRSSAPVATTASQSYSVSLQKSESGAGTGASLEYSSSPPSFLLLHQQQHPHLFSSSSAALSPKSLTSSTPSPVTVHDFNSGLNVVISATGSGSSSSSNMLTTVSRKCTTPSPIPIRPLLSPFGLSSSPSPFSPGTGGGTVTTPISSPLLHKRNRHISVSTPLSSPSGSGSGQSGTGSVAGSQKHDFRRMESLIERRDSESISPLVLIPQHSPATSTTSSMLEDEAREEERRKMMLAFTLEEEEEKDEKTENNVNCKKNVEPLGVEPSEKRLVEEQDLVVVVEVKAEDKQLAATSNENGKNKMQENDDHEFPSETIKSCDADWSEGNLSKNHADDRNEKVVEVNTEEGKGADEIITRNDVPETTLPSFDKRKDNYEETIISVANNYKDDKDIDNGAEDNRVKDVSFTSGYSSSLEDYNNCSIVEQKNNKKNKTKKNDKIGESCEGAKRGKKNNSKIKDKPSLKVNQRSNRMFHPRQERASDYKKGKNTEAGIKFNVKQTGKTNKKNARKEKAVDAPVTVKPKNNNNNKSLKTDVKTGKTEKKKKNNLGKQNLAESSISVIEDLGVASSGYNHMPPVPPPLPLSSSKIDRKDKKNKNKTVVSTLPNEKNAKKELKKNQRKIMKEEMVGGVKSGKTKSGYKWLSKSNVEAVTVTGKVKTKKGETKPGKVDSIGKAIKKKTSKKQLKQTTLIPGVTNNCNLDNVGRLDNPYQFQAATRIVSTSVSGDINLSDQSKSLINSSPALVPPVPASASAPQQVLILSPTQSVTPNPAASQVTFLIASPTHQPQPSPMPSSPPEATIRIPAYIPRASISGKQESCSAPFIATTDQIVGVGMEESYGPATLTLHRDIGDATSPPSSSYQQVPVQLGPPPAITIQYHHSAPATPMMIEAGSPCSFPMNMIKPEDNSLDLLATVAQEFGSREDLGKRLSVDGSCSSSIIGESPPMSPIKSPFSYHHVPQQPHSYQPQPPPPAVIFNNVEATTTANLTAVTSVVNSVISAGSAKKLKDRSKNKEKKAKEKKVRCTSGTGRKEKTKNSITVKMKKSRERKAAGKKEKRSISDSASYAPLPPVVLLKIPQVLPKVKNAEKVKKTKRKNKEKETEKGGDNNKKAVSEQTSLALASSPKLKTQKKKKQEVTQEDCVKLAKRMKKGKTMGKDEKKGKKEKTVKKDKTPMLMPTPVFSEVDKKDEEEIKKIKKAKNKQSTISLKFPIPPVKLSNDNPALSPNKPKEKTTSPSCFYTPPQRISAFAKQVIARRDSAAVTSTSPTKSITQASPVTSPLKTPSSASAFFPISDDKNKVKEEDEVSPTIIMPQLKPFDFEIVPTSTPLPAFSTSYPQSSPSKELSDKDEPVPKAVQPPVVSPLPKPHPPPLLPSTAEDKTKLAKKKKKMRDHPEQDMKKTDTDEVLMTLDSRSLYDTDFKSSCSNDKDSDKFPLGAVKKSRKKKKKEVEGESVVVAEEIKPAVPSITITPSSKSSKGLSSEREGSFSPLTPPSISIVCHSTVGDTSCLQVNSSSSSSGSVSNSASTPGSSIILSSPSNVEEEETTTENENENDWVADPMLAVSAIKINTSSQPSPVTSGNDHDRDNDHSHTSSGDTDNGKVKVTLLSTDKRKKKRRRKSSLSSIDKPPKLSLYNKQTEAAVTSSDKEQEDRDRETFLEMKSQLKAFVHFKPKQLTGNKKGPNNVKPCLKAEPVIKSNTEDEDFELDLEVATITDKNDKEKTKEKDDRKKRKESTSSSVTGKKAAINRNSSSYPNSKKTTGPPLSTKEIMSKVFTRKVSPDLPKDKEKDKEKKLKNNNNNRYSKRSHSQNVPGHEMDADDEEEVEVEAGEDEELLDIEDIPSKSLISMTAAATAVVVNNSSVTANLNSSAASTTLIPKKSPKKRNARSSTTSSTASTRSRGNRGQTMSFPNTSSATTATSTKNDETTTPGKVELDSVAELIDEMRILTEIQGLFYTGRLNALQPPDVYGVTLDNERGAPPHLIFSAEEVLEKCLREKKPKTLTSNLRICAYWSPQYSGLYPGRISTDFNPKFDPENDLIPIEFDDGDTGVIKLKEIRLLSVNHPIREYDPNPLLTLEKKHRKRRHSSATGTSGGCTGDHAESDCGEPYCAKVGKLEDDEDDDEDEDDDHNHNHTSGRGGGSKMLYWTWSGLGYKRPQSKKNRNKEFFHGIQRGDEVLKVGDAALFISTGNERPFIGRVERFWEQKGKKMVNVRWFYHPEEVKASAKRLSNLKYPGALFESPHIDENDVQTIAKKCDVLPFPEFKQRLSGSTSGSLRLAKLSAKSSSKPRDMYYVAGFYDPYTYNLTLKNLK